jgi:hypothetical protein
MAINLKHWPHDHKSGMVDREIDWLRASPLAFHAGPPMWKRIPKKDARALMGEESLRGIWMSLPQEIQEIVKEVAEGEEAKQRKARKELDNTHEKNDILKQIRETITEAEDAEDLTAKLRGIELLAKVQNLLTQKPQEDPTIIINVISGVERGNQDG